MSCQAIKKCVPDDLTAKTLLMMALQEKLTFFVV
jgi:hypothetical protein